MFSDYVAPFLAEFSGGTIFPGQWGVRPVGIRPGGTAGRSDERGQSHRRPYAGSGEVVIRVTAHAADGEAPAPLRAGGGGDP